MTAPAVFLWFRCACGGVLRIHQEAAGEPCPYCRGMERTKIDQPPDVRVCPYCNRAYQAAWGTCPFCEDR